MGRRWPLFINDGCAPLPTALYHPSANKIGGDGRLSSKCHGREASSHSSCQSSIVSSPLARHLSLLASRGNEDR